MSHPSKRQRAASNGAYHPQSNTTNLSALHSPQPASGNPQTLSTAAISQSYTSATPIEDYQSWVSSLPQETVEKLLVQAARTHPDIEGLLRNEVDQLIQRNRARVISFDHLSKSAWHTINQRGGSGTQQYEGSFDAYWSVVANIKTIEEGCPDHASFGTKKNGLETLRKIGKSICLGNNDTLGHEVRKQFQSNEDLSDTMLKILDSLSDDELNEVSQSDWGNKLEELVKLANDYCLFNGSLDNVLRTLDGEESSEDEGDEGDEEGDNEEDEDDDEEGEEEGHSEKRPEEP